VTKVRKWTTVEYYQSHFGTITLSPTLILNLTYN